MVDTNPRANWEGKTFVQVMQENTTDDETIVDSLVIQRDVCARRHEGDYKAFVGRLAQKKHDLSHHEMTTRALQAMAGEVAAKSPDYIQELTPDVVKLITNKEQVADITNCRKLMSNLGNHTPDVFLDGIIIWMCEFLVLAIKGSRPFDKLYCVEKGMLEEKAMVITSLVVENSSILEENTTQMFHGRQEPFGSYAFVPFWISLELCLCLFNKRKNFFGKLFGRIDVCPRNKMTAFLE